MRSVFFALGLLPLVALGSAAEPTALDRSVTLQLTEVLPQKWFVRLVEINAVPYNLGFRLGARKGTRIVLVGPTMVKGPRGINDELESFTLWLMPADFTPVTPETVAQFQDAQLLGANATVAVYCKTFTTDTPTWSTWKEDIVKFLELQVAAQTAPVSGANAAVEPPPRSYLVPHQDGERPDVLSYSKTEFLEHIKVHPVALSKEQLQTLAALPKAKSEWGVRWLVAEKPDTMKNGPWTTRLDLFTADDPSHCLQVELIDHSQYEIRARWLNEKLLFVSVPWGRIAWTDFILDVETQRTVSVEDGRLDAVNDWPEPATTKP